MRRETIAVDIDEVLVAHSEDLIKWYNEQYGTQLTLADNHSEDLGVWGTKTREEAIRRVQKYIHSPELSKRPPFKEAVKSLKKISKNYNLVVVTSRDTIVEKATRRWLNEHFKEIFKSAHFTAEYNLEGKSTTKATICQTIGADFLIDDRLDIAEEVSKVGIKVILFGDYPWNQAERLPQGVARCKDWPAVLEYFDEQG